MVTQILLTYSQTMDHRKILAIYNNKASEIFIQNGGHGSFSHFTGYAFIYFLYTKHEIFVSKFPIEDCVVLSDFGATSHIRIFDHKKSGEASENSYKMIWLGFFFYQSNDDRFGNAARSCNESKYTKRENQSMARDEC